MEARGGEPGIEQIARLGALGVHLRLAELTGWVVAGAVVRVALNDGPREEQAHRPPGGGHHQLVPAAMSGPSNERWADGAFALGG